jgi:Domain of unknown function (DUF1902)
MAVVRQRISIKIACDVDSGLLLAQSSDLPALMVPAQSLEEIQPRILQSIREILEFTGVRVVSVKFEDDEPHFPPGFLPAIRYAHTEIEAGR